MNPLELSYWDLFESTELGDSDQAKLKEDNRRFDLRLQCFLKTSEVRACRPQPAIFVGLYPALTVNARVFTGDGGFIVLVHSGLIDFILHTLGLYVATIPMLAGGRIVEPDLSTDDAGAHLRRIVDAYSAGSMRSLRPMVPTQPRIKMAELIFPLTLDFVIAHEIGHVTCGHLDDSNTQPSELGGAILRTYIDNWKSEFEADAAGMNMLAEVSADVVGPPDTLYLGAVFFFELIDILERRAAGSDAGTNFSISTTHPPASARRTQLASAPGLRTDLLKSNSLDGMVETMQILRSYL